LQIRFLFSYLQLILIIVLIFSLFFFKYTSSVLIERETTNIVNLASYLQPQTDQAVRVMDNVSINVGYSNLVLSNLDNYFAAPQHNRQDIRKLADHFVALNGTEIQVEQINVYNFSGEVVGFGKNNVQTFTNLEDKDWYVPTVAQHGLKHLSLPGNAGNLSGDQSIRNYSISLYRTYTNRYGKPVGIIETVQTCSTIFKSLILIQKADPAAPAFYIFNENNQPVYPFSLAASSSLSVPSGYLKQLDPTTDHILIKNPQSGSKDLVAFKHSPYTEWTYLVIQPERIILAPVNHMVAILIGVVILLILSASLLSYSMSLRLSRPIRELHDIICNTELDNLGDLPGHPLQDGFSEVEELNTAFHVMSIKLKKSKDDMIAAQQQEMKARSVALQAQINPHFYYNSLASIIVLAKKGMNDSIIQLCQNLTGIMRYVTHVNASQVTLEEEITYLKQYLFCMKVRYQDSLDYEVNIEPDLAGVRIPKLLIQPLVENALKYGTNCPPPWKIIVQGRRLDSSFMIEVLDSGPGFTEDTLEHFRQLKSQIDANLGLVDSELGGMGLSNVYARWKLFSGQAGFLICENRAEGGARVRIGWSGGCMP
jgi:two-component system sensor histidine kinase YesM